MNIDLNIQNKKLELIQWLSTLEDLRVIEKIIEVKKYESIDWWDNISKNEKQSIEMGLLDADAGKLHPHAAAKKLYEKWL